MNNVQIETKGNQIVITIDGSKDLGLSASGKTRLVGTTQGNKQIAVGGRVVYVGVNAYCK